MEKLQSILSQFRLKEDVQNALIEIIIDPHGLEEIAAPGLVASLLDIPMSRANQIIIELLTNKLVIQKKLAEESRLTANYEFIGIDDKFRKELLTSQKIFVDMGEAHSEAAMSLLNSFFDTNKKEIFIGCEITSHHMFQRLEERAESQRKTVFLFPRKRDLEDRRHVHYDEILAEWYQFISKGPSYLRKYISIQITKKPYPQIYTSSLSEKTARLDLFNISGQSTRKGTLIQVDSEISLYYLLKQNYTDALNNSIPYWKLWPLEAIWYWLKKIIVPVILIFFGALLSNSTNPYFIFLFTTIGGVLGQFLWELFGGLKWKKIELFKK